MQRHLLFLQILGAAVIALVALGSVHAGIANTKHNLSSTGSFSVKALDFGSGGTTEICLFCHTPHMTESKGANIPLWNHELSGHAVYGVYTSASFNGVTREIAPIAVTTQTATVSNLCLSCHDGTVAINSLYNASNMNSDVNPKMDTSSSRIDGSGMLLGPAMIGTNLTNDHPVNFTYDSALVASDKGVQENLVQPGDDAGTGLAPVKLFNGMVQCASCHDPHIDYGTLTAQRPFLRVPITGSQLCLTCHIK